MAMRDLSQHHQPVTDLFPPLHSEAGRNASPISPDQVQFFREQGYLAGLRVLTDAQVDAMCEELERFFDPEHEGRDLWYEYHTNESADPSQVLFHALGAWRVGPAFHDVLWNPAFTVPASQLLSAVANGPSPPTGGEGQPSSRRRARQGEGASTAVVPPHPSPLPREERGPQVPVRFWHDQLFCKPPRHGGVVAWHQDYSYWTRTHPMQHLTCWIGLDDSTVENGCVHYVPGSHKWDLLPITGLAGDMEAIREVLTDEQWEQFQKPVAIELKRGECAFHHPLMVHGSYENRTDRPRRACVLNVVADGVCSQSDDSLLAGVPPIPAGERLDGQFFPLLYEP